jgi:hypothetical protein
LLASLLSAFRIWQVYITDLSNPRAPSLYSPGAKSNAPYVT